MNNIEILENAIKCNKKQFEEIGTHILLQDDEMKAIENLIQENKELKKEDKKYIVKLTDEQYRKLVDIIRNEINKEWETKIKEIIYPTPENPIPFEVQTSEMYKKLEKLVEGE